MFKNALFFRIDEASADQMTAHKLEEGAALARFEPCGPTEPMRAGWVEPRGIEHGPLVEVVNGQWILKLRVQKRTVPASAVQEELDKRCEAIERETGARPGRRQIKEIKELVVQELMPRAFTKTSDVLVWISPKARLMVVGASSMSKVDAVATELVKAFAEVGVQFKLHHIKVAQSPSQSMSYWLVQRESPQGFTVDAECELKDPESSATVRYLKHTLEIDEIVGHIKQGKRATKLAMTWSDRLSFVLGEGMEIRKIQLTDVALDSSPQTGPDEVFDADVALYTGELLGLIDGLIEALGGEVSGEESAGDDRAGEPDKRVQSASNDHDDTAEEMAGLEAA